jgi:ankyrin repeat protein
MRNAILSDDDTGLRALISKVPTIVSSKDEHSRTPLHLAAMLGSPKVAKILLENKADPDARDDNKDTPLHIAAASGNSTLVQLLISHKSDPDASDRFGFTPNEYAIEYHRKAVQDVLKGCKRYQVRLTKDQTKIRDKLTHAILGCNTQDVTSLLKADASSGATINAWDENTGNTTLIGVLTMHKAKETTAQRQTILSFDEGTDKTMTEIAKALLSAGANPNAADFEGEAPVMNLTGPQAVERLKLLEKFGAWLQLKDKDGDGLLSRIDASTPQSFADYAIEHGVDVNAKYKHAETPLMTACEVGNLGIVSSLLKHGARVDDIDMNGKTALHYLAEVDRSLGVSEDDLMTIGKALLSAHASPSLKDKKGLTPSQVATKQGRAKLSRFLLSSAGKS